MQAYIIEKPDGTLIPETISRLVEVAKLSEKAQVIYEYEAMGDESWKKLARSGYKCVLVEIKKI